MEVATEEYVLAELQKLRNMLDVRFRNIEEQLKSITEQGEEHVH